jgi:hypothetical protein
MNRRMSLLHGELSASIDEFSATMTESVRSMTALSDDTLAEARAAPSRNRGTASATPWPNSLRGRTRSGAASTRSTKT